MDMTSLMTVEGRSIGLDKVAQDVDRVVTSQEKAAASGEVLAQSQEKVSRSSISVGKSMDTYTRYLDPLSRAQERVERGERLIAIAQQQGVEISDSFMRALGNAKARHEELSKATNDNAQAMGLNRLQMMETVHVVKALSDEIIAGQSPLRALAMEGGRIGQIFSMGEGGVGATLSAFGGLVARFALSPLALLTTGVGAASLAYYQFTRQQEELERALNGVGRAAGVNAEGLRALGARGATAGGLSAGQGIELAGQYAGAGIAGGNIGSLVADTQRFSRAFGVDMEKAQGEIEKIVSADGLGAFEKRFGTASFAEKDLVRSLEASGRFIDAQTEKTRLFNEELKKTIDASWSISRAWDGVKSAISGATQSFGQFVANQVNGPSLQQQLAAARGDYFYLNAQRRGQASAYPGEAAAEARVRELEQRIEDERQKATQAARDLDLNRRSQLAGGIIDELSPDSSRLRGLAEKRDALKIFVDSQDAIAKLGDRADGARKAFDQLSTQIENFETGAQRIATDSGLATRVTEARTFVEKAAVAADKARLDVLRDSGDAIKASAAAEAARNALIAEGNRKAADRARSAADELSMAGLTPYERARRQVMLEDRDLREQYAPGKGDLAPYARPAASGLDSVAAAANAAANALGRLAGGPGGASSSLPTFAGGGAGFDPRGLSGYIAARAAAYGIDPSIALRVAGSEGLGTFTGDAGSSYGAFQLHRGGIAGGGNRVSGLGDDFFRETGLDPSDPANERATIDYALRYASHHGWGAFHGAGRVGLGNFAGIGGRGTNDNFGPTPSTAAGDIPRGTRDKLRAIDIEQIDGPLRKVNDDIDAQRALLKAQTDAFGKSTAETARAAKEQDLLNQYASQGVTENKLGKQAFDELRASVAETAKRYGDLAQETEDARKQQAEMIAVMDGLRGASRDALGTFVSDLRQGKRAGDALTDSLGGIADKLTSLGIDKLISGLLGENGKAGGGLAGGAIFDFIKGLFSFADGGVMTARGPLPLHRYAFGGVANSPQLALFGEGRGPEAFVPLPDGRSIPVAIKQARAANQSIAPGTFTMPKTEVHLHGATPGTQVKESATKTGGRRIDIVMAEAVAGAQSHPSVRQSFRAANSIVQR